MLLGCDWARLRHFQQASFTSECLFFVFGNRRGRSSSLSETMRSLTLSRALPFLLRQIRWLRENVIPLGAANRWTEPLGAVMTVTPTWTEPWGAVMTTPVCMNL